MGQTETAILAGGCFWGMQDLIRKLPASFPRASATAAATCRMRRIAITARMPRRSRSSSIRSGSLTATCSSSSSRSTIRRRRTARATTPARRIARASTTSRVRSAMSPRTRSPTSTRRSSGRVESSRRSRRPGLLGGGARASGLSAALSRRLHVPLPSAELEAAAARGADGVADERRTRAVARRAALEARARVGRRATNRHRGASRRATRNGALSSRREEYQVARGKGTERPFTSQMCALFTPGRYDCVCCGTPLFDSTSKFDSRTGWPSFTQPLERGVVGTTSTSSHGMQRVETTCNVCDAHLGHVFPDGPPPSGLRFCINAVSLRKAQLPE